VNIYSASQRIVRDFNPNYGYKLLRMMVADGNFNLVKGKSDVGENLRFNFQESNVRLLKGTY